LESIALISLWTLTALVSGALAPLRALDAFTLRALVTLGAVALKALRSLSAGSLGTLNAGALRSLNALVPEALIALRPLRPARDRHPDRRARRRVDADVRDPGARVDPHRADRVELRVVVRDRGRGGRAEVVFDVDVEGDVGVQAARLLEEDFAGRDPDDDGARQAVDRRDPGVGIDRQEQPVVAKIRRARDHQLT
jgi:hypothetical protein